MKSLPINNFFERVVVLNLDRRPDRWADVSASLDRAGIRAERFAAIDGQSPDVKREWEAYRALPPAVMPQGVAPMTNSFGFYSSGNRAARLAYAERAGQKALTLGAWGYLKSMHVVLHRALADGVKSLLVFDDDVMFHKRANELFAAAVADLPDDWRILQLGTMQHHWTDDWMSWVLPLLYRSKIGAVGSHAVGIRTEAIPFLIEEIMRMDMPYDDGPLAMTIRAMPGYVIYPNLAIQKLDGPSDVGSSGFLARNSKEKAAGTFRWKLEDYR